MTERDFCAIEFDNLDNAAARAQRVGDSTGTSMRKAGARSMANDEQRQRVARRQLEHYLDSRRLDSALRDVFDES